MGNRKYKYIKVLCKDKRKQVITKENILVKI